VAVAPAFSKPKVLGNSAPGGKTKVHPQTKLLSC